MEETSLLPILWLYVSRPEIHGDKIFFSFFFLASGQYSFLALDSQPVLMAYKFKKLLKFMLDIEILSEKGTMLHGANMVRNRCS